MTFKVVFRASRERYEVLLLIKVVPLRKESNFHYWHFSIRLIFWPLERLFRRSENTKFNLQPFHFLKFLTYLMPIWWHYTVAVASIVAAVVTGTAAVVVVVHGKQLDFIWTVFYNVYILKMSITLSPHLSLVTLAGLNFQKLTSHYINSLNISFTI